VNLGSKNKVPMKELRESLEAQGFEAVRTYIQSGNVIVQSGDPAVKVGKRIEKAIEDAYGLQIAVITRTLADMKRVLEGNPYLPKQKDLKALHVMFLADKPKASVAKALEPGRFSPDDFSLKGREIFLNYPTGMGRSKMTLGYFERKLGIAATARNWNTVNKLTEMMESG
jgi:uncharacterized protein (DUF1697 family)